MDTVPKTWGLWPSIRSALMALPLALAPALPQTAQAPADRTIVFFGDSLTAGLGLPDPGTQSYPAQVQRMIDAEHLHWHVVNAGLSGETSAGGLRRVDWVLKQGLDVFFLELGANDGLRGVSTEETQANLQAVIDHVRSRYPQARIVLAGIQMPPNMGADYTESFQAIFPALAKKNHLTLVPFLLEGVAERPGLNQADGMHPNPEGAAIVARVVWRELGPLLEAK